MAQPGQANISIWAWGQGNQTEWVLQSATYSPALSVALEQLTHTS